LYTNQKAGTIVTTEESIVTNSKGAFQIIFGSSLQKSSDISNEQELVATGFPPKTRLEYVHLFQLHGGSAPEDKSETNPKVDAKMPSP